MKTAKMCRRNFKEIAQGRIRNALELNKFNILNTKNCNLFKWRLTIRHLFANNDYHKSLTSFAENYRRYGNLFKQLWIYRNLLAQ